MKKTVSETGTIHLFDDADVRKTTARGVEHQAASFCGTLETEGPFTGVADVDDILDGDAICSNCAKSVQEDDGGD